MMIAYLVYIIPLILDTYSSSSNERLAHYYILVYPILGLDLVFIFPAALVILNLGIFDHKNQGVWNIFSLDVCCNDYNRNSG